MKRCKPTGGELASRLWSSRLFCMVAAFSISITSVAEDQPTFLATHCVKCHGEQKQEAELRLDTLRSPTADSESAATWETVARMIATADMPPQQQPRPAPQQTERMLSWIGRELARAQPAASAIRRLNRREYEYSVQDLLQIDTSLADLLPEDASVQGFDNVAGGLGLSSILMERYLEAADVAFENVIRRVKPLPADTRHVDLMDQKDNIDSVKKAKGGVIESSGAFVDFTPGWPPSRTDPAHPIEGGIYECRIAVWPYEPGEHRTLTVAVFVGPLFGPGQRRFMGMYDVSGTPDAPRIIEFTTRMNELDALHILPWIYPEHVTWRDKEEPRPGVGVVWAETHGPLDQAFPSESQDNVFGTSSTITMEEGASIYIRHRRGVKSQHVVSSTPREDITRIIREFIPRAFRRPVDEALTEQFVQLALDRLEQGRTFEQAVRAGVTAVLCSPYFLLLNQQQTVDDYTIASRLSYFLWSSMPDSELLSLAAEGKLSDPGIRYGQVERMIDDPKFDRFVNSFTGQWLDLHDIEFTTPDKKLYPEYDELLMRSMLAESQGFFSHMIEQDLGVLNFVDSNVAVLNQRLAEHYGVPGVSGHEHFRVITLPRDSRRGGILTQASVLKVTANGTTTSPVIRGAWVLDKLLGQPAPPPPTGIPAVEPDIRGATTIREQLDRHRNDQSCARCHARIDPPGFALEEFDVIGGHREWYRSLSNRGERVAKTNYRVGPTVEQGGHMPDGRSFANFVEFRNMLKQDPDRIVRSIAEKLLVYGCGRPVTIVERPSVDAVMEASTASGFGLRTMIHAVTDSDLFLGP
jgi:Protein of unknown function (DUF1592)/Protein of unknown function (DUF1588)/Protein of unknown function (DUF1587)/Protein of unknown function (DUF1585)/Protein of unknown function (DUF1595)/Planctomycete cytochrome C